MWDILSGTTVLAIDVGGHRVKAAILRDGNQTDLVINRYPSVELNPEIAKSMVPGEERIKGTLQIIKSLYNPRKVTHLAISSTDIVDYRSATILRASSPSYQGTNWSELLCASSLVEDDVFFCLQNDAKCGAWGEYNLMKTPEQANPFCFIASKHISGVCSLMY